MIFQRNKKYKSLIIDVGSSDVSLAVVSLNDISKSLLEISKSSIEIIEDKGEVHLLKKIVLEKIKSSLVDVDFRKIDEIHIFLSAPWHLCVYKTLSINLNGQHLLNKHSIKEILDRDVESVSLEGKEIIFKDPVGFTLDGYNIKNIEGKKPKSLEINVLEGYAPASFINNIKDILGFFNTGCINFHSFNLPAFSLISSKFKKERFVSIDFAGEVLEVSVIEKGFLKENVSIPLGINDIYRLISNKFSINLSSAVSLFSLYLEKKLDLKTKKEIDLILEKDFKDILYAKLKGNIFKNSIDRSFFKNIFIYTDDKFRNFLKDIFSDYFLSGTVLQEGDIRISTIRSSMFDGLLSYSSNSDIFTLCEAYYIDKLYNSKI